MESSNPTAKKFYRQFYNDLLAIQASEKQSIQVNFKYFNQKLKVLSNLFIYFSDALEYNFMYDGDYSSYEINFELNQIDIGKMYPF